MKILQINKFFYPKGGAEISFFGTAKLLEQNGHKVTFFSVRHPKNLFSECEKYFVSNVDYEDHSLKNIIKSSCRILYALSSKRKIEELIHNQKPDLAHLHNIYHQISPSIIHSLKKFNIPVIMTLHDYKMVCASYLMLCDGKLCEACRQGKYYHCFLKGCVKNSKAKSLLSMVEMYLHHKILHIYDLVDVFISPSVFLKNKLEELGFKGKIIHLPNFVIVGEFTPNYNWQDNSIVYFGRLSEEKGLTTLVRAMKGVNINLKIIGNGPIEEKLKSKIRDEGINNVYFLGYKNGQSLKNEIRKSMLIIVPSECYENNPRSVIEAFALGKPVIGAHIGGIPDLVKDNETGLTFEPGNEQDLRNKVVQLLKNPDKIVGMGKNARKFVEEKLNEKIHYKKLMRIYNSIL